MGAADVGIVGELVVRNRGVGPEGGNLHVTDIAVVPLVALVLQVFNELVLCLPLSPTVSRDESVGQMLLRPGGIVLHLSRCGVLLQLLNLLGNVGVAGLSVNGDA